jgi:hypothetical protein
MTRKRDRTLTFGKYEGWSVRDVPEDYLQWLLSSSEDTATMCREEIARREAEEEATMGMMERIIKAGYRDLAKKYHPDAGGDNEQMKELNASYDALNGALQGKARRG